jgi:isopentenyl-diphosphate delta-isomerase type 1
MPLDNQSELFYLVDNDDQPLGSLTRQEAHCGTRKIHRSVGIFLISTNGQMLMQQRSPQKDIDPGRWSYSVGGHVTFGQTYAEAAVRELEEELGIKNYQLSELGRYLIESEREREFTTFFKTNAPTTINLCLDKDEVSAVQWVALTEIAQFAQDHPMTAWTKKGLQLTGFC